MTGPVQLKDIVEALEVGGDEVTSYVNSATGEIRTLTPDLVMLAESDEPDEDLVDWQRQEAAQAREVLAGGDWLELPNQFEIHEWSIMERFAHSLRDDDQRDDLLQSLRGSGAFGHFKSAVRRLKVETQWFAYREAALEEIARAWLDDHSLSYR